MLPLTPAFYTGDREPFWRVPTKMSKQDGDVEARVDTPKILDMDVNRQIRKAFMYVFIHNSSTFFLVKSQQTKSFST